MFGEITNAEKAGWQLRALKTLEIVLEEARLKRNSGQELPTIEWTVDTGLMVIGRVNGFTQDPAKARADFEAWRDFLGAEMRLNVAHEDGRVVLTAETKSAERNGVTVMVHADISAPLDGEDTPA